MVIKVFRLLRVARLFVLFLCLNQLLLALCDVLFHFFFNQMRTKHYGECPVLVLANRDQNVLFLEEIDFFCPSLHASVPVAHFVASHVRLRHFWRLLQLCEELRVEYVHLFVQRFRNHVVLQKSQVEKHENVVEVDTRLQKFKILLRDFDRAIEISVDQFAHHVVFL